MSDFKKLTAYEPCGVEYVSVGGTSYIEQMKAENAKLRQQLEDVTVSMGRVEERCAKLRELAQRADRLLTDLFPHIDYSRCTALEAVAAWRVRARELEVEVPANDKRNSVRLAMCEGHPETLILVDTTNMGVYKYVPAVDQGGVREATSEFLRKRVRELGVEL